MADRVRKVDYCYAKVSNRAGQGVKLLAQLRDADVNLLAFSGFPIGGGRSQLDFIPEKMTELKQVAREHGWRLSKTKKGFLVTGTDRTGAVHRHLAKLAEAKINVVAADAVMAGAGRYGMILWVRPRDYRRATRVLGAR